MKASTVVTNVFSVLSDGTILVFDCTGFLLDKASPDSKNYLNIIQSLTDKLNEFKDSRLTG